MRYRMERDVLGNVRIPADAYYGSETCRAAGNFRISGLKIDREFIIAYVKLKKAAAIANMKAGKLDKGRCRAIVKACDQLINGKHLDQFVVDVFQAGAGTSTNMNVNEVISNISIELLKGRKGDYRIMHPNDHVNMSQSTNDTYHTAIHIACHDELKMLGKALVSLENAFAKKSVEFGRIKKIGRTHLQDAVPMSMGSEFSGYAGAVSKLIEHLGYVSGLLLEVPLGGTALGTGINAGKEYTSHVYKELFRVTGAKFRKSRFIFTDMSQLIEELYLADFLGDSAAVLTKIANDFRLLGSGPRAGLNELILPAVQPGSSIMPGKINPSIAEALNMVCFQVSGNAGVVREAARAGQMELNVFMPVVAYDLLYSIRILSNAINMFVEKCVRGVKANSAFIEKELSMDLSIATALNPYIGYSKASKVARYAYKNNISVKEACIRMGILDKQKLEKILDPDKM